MSFSWKYAGFVTWFVPKGHLWKTRLRITNSWLLLLKYTSCVSNLIEMTNSMYIIKYIPKLYWIEAHTITARLQGIQKWYLKLLKVTRSLSTSQWQVYNSFWIMPLKRISISIYQITLVCMENLKLSSYFWRKWKKNFWDSM